MPLPLVTRKADARTRMRNQDVEARHRSASYSKAVIEGRCKKRGRLTESLATPYDSTRYGLRLIVLSARGLRHIQKINKLVDLIGGQRQTRERDRVSPRRPQNLTLPAVAECLVYRDECGAEQEIALPKIRDHRLNPFD